MSPGIPPSLDRQERQRTIVAGGAVVIAVFAALLYVAVFRAPGPFVPADPIETSGEERLAAYLAEEVRASAYEALRDHLDQRKSEPDIVAVFCRDCSHRWIGELIEFTGDVDFERTGGRLDRFSYQATLAGSEDSGWEVQSLELTPAIR